MSRTSVLSLALLQGLAISSLSILVSMLRDSQTFGNIVFVRSLGVLVLLFPFCFSDLRKLMSKEAIYTWGRGILSAGALLCLFYNLTTTSPSVAASFASFSSVFVILLSYIFLKERPSYGQWIGVGVAILCMLMLKSAAIEDLLGSNILIGMVGAFLGGSAMIALKKASSIYGPSLILWCNGLVALIAAGFLDIETSMMLGDAAVLCFLILLTIVSQISLTYIYRGIPAIEAVVVTRASVVITMVMEILILEREITYVQALFVLGIMASAVMISKPPARKTI